MKVMILKRYTKNDIKGIYEKNDIKGIHEKNVRRVEFISSFDQSLDLDSLQRMIQEEESKYKSG